MVSVRINTEKQKVIYLHQTGKKYTFFPVFFPL